MPTDKKPRKRKTTKKESGKENKLKFVEPKKFILHIAKCGTDSISMRYNKIEQDNPILLGLHGVKLITNSVCSEEVKPFFEYLLACSILHGLEFDRTKIFEDIDNISDRIKGLSLKDNK